MKKFYLLIICVLIASTAFCAPFYIYTATRSGLWSDMAVWNITVRTDGKLKTKVIIPASYNIVVDNNVNSFGLGDVEIQLAGKLNMQPNTTISLSAPSSLELIGTGQIIGNNNTEKINIGAVTKYDGSKDFSKSGAAIATATTGVSPFGFTPTGLLAVKLESFTAEQYNSAVLLKWSTSAEISNDYFAIQRSYDGSSWTTIATVKGNGTTQTVSTYRYTDNNSNNALIYYRLRQVDIDGASEFSVVRTIGSNVSTVSKIYAFNKNIVIEPTKDIKTAVNVAVMTTGGQLILKQQYSGAAKITINLTSANTGGNIVVVNISNNNGLNESSKLIL